MVVCRVAETNLSDPCWSIAGSLSFSVGSRNTLGFGCNSQEECVIVF